MVQAYPADNLLKVSAFCKWKCLQPGSEFASVTLKFASPVQFSRIDIGNEASAFILVEVSRADSSDFEVLLPSSSFMSPDDSRKSISLNRVRIFSDNELISSTACQKWDTVRIVCTQPFNRNIQYGLAFIRFYRVADAQDIGLSAAAEEDCNFESKTAEILKPGGLFKLSRKNGKDQAVSSIINESEVKAAVPATGFPTDTVLKSFLPLTSSCWIALYLQHFPLVHLRGFLRNEPCIF